MKEMQAVDKRIPKAIFIENVQQACRKETSQNLLAALDQQHNKYRLVESQLHRSLLTMQSKIPEIEKTLQMIDSLRAQSNPEVDFMLSDGIFVKAKAKQGVNKVSLWLGASTIVQLTFDEAEKLLRQNLSNAKKSSKQITEELQYVRDQRTTTEVNVARVYNHSLVEKREEEIKKAQRRSEDD